MANISMTQSHQSPTVMSSDGTSSTRKDEFGSELEDDWTQGCDDASSEAFCISRATEIPVADKLLRSIILAQMRTASGKDFVQMEYWDVIVKKFDWVADPRLLHESQNVQL